MKRPAQKTIKPGAERRGFRPDSIATFTVAEAAPLIEFLASAMPERKRTAIKQLLKYDQVKVNGNVTSQFDTPPWSRVQLSRSTSPARSSRSATAACSLSTRTST